MDSNTPPKKGLGVLAWLGIGCGGLVAVGIIVFSTVFTPEIREYLYKRKHDLDERAHAFAEEAQKNPTRMTATMMVKIGAGQFEMVAEDDVNKRYTVREKKIGTLTTIYWSEKDHAPKTIPGDFSAIPADSAPSTPEPAPK